MTPIKADRLYRNDRQDRPLAKDEKGNIYCNVNTLYGSENWHAVTESGEPSHPVKLHFVVHFSDPIY